MCPIMISNQYSDTKNAMPLAIVANMLCGDSEFAVTPSLSRKRLSVSSSYRCCDAPAFKKRRRDAAPKKTVRFAEENNTVAIKTVTREDLDCAWYQPMEVAFFKLDSKNSVYELYRANGDVSKLSKDHCIRGLENVVTPTAAMAHRKSRKERVAAVLYQQQLQRETSTANPELLKLISSLFSQQRCDDAVRLAALDSTVWTQF
jgi:hypothetical protein